ncbi:uncharacterized protein DS421_19g660390 [Arachis hypogaea]|uniref:Uncharacterized protein n=1 Tax=Arachis hypogaea TaxID=3818 RepID=A0A6B9VDF5_ARAHY|nr:uncharacterized protein DS421_19g660390 [Arachis hypogaea]
MCLVKRALSKLVTEQNALGLNQFLGHIEESSASFPRAMVVDSIQTLDPINTWSEQKVKLNDAEHKLKDQGRQLKVQQKRIGSTKKTIHALYKKLNLPLPSTLSDPTKDELGIGSSDDEDDNISD